MITLRPLALTPSEQWQASAGGFYANAGSPWDALYLLHLLVAWHRAPNGWRSRLAWWRLKLFIRLH